MSQKRNYSLMKPKDVYLLVARGKLKKFPDNYLDKPTIKEIVRYVILELYHYTRDDVCRKANHKFFQENYLGGVRKFFEMKNYEVIKYSFPEWNIKPWEMEKVPNSFWCKQENLKEFILWVAAKEGVDPSTKEGLRKLTADVVQKYGGSKPLLHAKGLYPLLNLAAEGRFMEWEIIKMVSWPEEKIVSATRWLVETKLRYTPEQVCTLKVADFVKNNLDGMLQKGCNHSILRALELAYPGMYYREGISGIYYRR